MVFVLTLCKGCPNSFVVFPSILSMPRENLISGDFLGVITEKGEQAVFFTAGVSFSGFHDLGVLKAKAR